MKVLVTGGTGMVGKALQELRPKWTYLGSKNFDLTCSKRVEEMFHWSAYTHVIHLAAMVGGVKGNSDYVGDFCADNLQINTNVLKEAHLTLSCKKVVSLLSTCVYPDAEHVKYPLTEDQLHAGPPHSSNYGYAHAKRMLEVQSRAYNQQFPDGTEFICAIPNNIYGKYDNFDLDNGHVIPALIRKAHKSKKNKFIYPKLWGDGTPLREFTYAGDIARALIFLTENDCKFTRLVNIGTTDEITIKEAWETLKLKVGMKFDRVIWDKSKPQGQHRKPSDNAKFLELHKEVTGEDFKYASFDEGITEVCDWFLENHPNVRGVH